MSIIVYKDEIKDGLADAITKSNVVAYDSLLRAAVKPEANSSKIALASSNVNLNDDNLYYLDAILASIGVNNNDDVFLKEETWLARNTPVHKQFNYMHNQRDIIGHIFASNVFDVDGKLISDETAFDDVPDFFDIVTSAVLYKEWPQEDLQERMDKIVEEIPQGLWYVSMECFFRHFDYAFATEDGLKIVARNSKTSFLTKHLRYYGGAGEYNGQKIKRVLRRFSFNGKGLVTNPANKRSIIFDNIERLKTYSMGEIKKMPEEKNEMELKTAVLSTDNSVVAEMLAKANDENAKLRDELKAKMESDLAAAKSAFDAELAKANADLTAKATEIETLKTQVTEALAMVKTRDTELAAASTELTTLKAENKKQERINQLVQAGVKEGVNDIVTKWSSVADEQFKDIVNLYSEAAKKVVEKKDEDKEDKDEMAEAAQKALDAKKVEVIDDSTEKAIALASQQINVDDEKKLMASASAWLGGLLTNQKKNKGE